MIYGKKVFLGFLFLAACAVLFAGAGAEKDFPPAGKVAVNPAGFPIVNEPLSLTVFGQRDPNHAEWKDVFVLKEYEKRSGIKMVYQEAPFQGFAEKKNLLFASNDLPDLFIRAMLSMDEVSRYGIEAQSLIPLDSFLQRYTPNLYKLYGGNNLLKQVLTSSDGKIYTLPSIDTSDTGRISFKQWINKDWLAAVGMKVPTNLKEFKDVLIAFRDRDPNKNGKKDEIPLGIREPSSIYELGGSFGLQTQMGTTINVVDGKVKFWLKDTRFKEYLQFLNDLYKEKLLWQDYYKNDRPAWRSNLTNALFGAMYMPYSDVFINVEKQFIGYDPLVGPYGDRIWASYNTNSGITYGNFAISRKNRSPEASLRWVDYFYSAEGSLFFRYGVEGQTFYYDSDRMPQINDNILKAPEGFMTALGKINLVPGAGFPCLIDNTTDGIVASKHTKAVTAPLVKFLPKAIYSRPAFNVQETDRVNAIWQDLVKYRDESVTKFIIGELGFDKWAEYTATLDKIGLGELEAIYQAAFSRQK